MKKIEDEIELKKELDNFHVRYGDLKNDFIFLVEFYDNKSDTIISRGLYTSPISAIRDLGNIIPAVKLPLKDITSVLTYVLPVQAQASNPALYIGIELSPYLYFPKAEIEAKLKAKKE